MIEIRFMQSDRLPQGSGHRLNFAAIAGKVFVTRVRGTDVQVIRVVADVSPNDAHEYARHGVAVGMLCHAMFDRKLDALGWEISGVIYDRVLFEEMDQ